MGTRYSPHLFICNFLWASATEDLEVNEPLEEVLVDFVNLVGLFTALHLNCLLPEVRNYIFAFWGICFVWVLFCLFYLSYSCHTFFWDLINGKRIDTLTFSWALIKEGWHNFHCSKLFQLVLKWASCLNEQTNDLAIIRTTCY